MKQAIKKYGVENFEKEILFVFDNEEKMNKKETEIINSEFLKRSDIYNLCEGGKGGFSYINEKRLQHHSNRTYHSRERMNEIRPLTKTLEAKKKSVETKRRNISLGLKEHQKSFLGKTHSQYTKNLMSKKAKERSSGSQNSQFGTVWITDGLKNKKIKNTDFIPTGWRRGRVL